MQKQITVSLYAKWRGITTQAVTKMIRQKGSLPGIINIKQFSKFYLLTPTKEFLAQNDTLGSKSDKIKINEK